MNALWVLNGVSELVGCGIFFILGLSGCLYAYGFSSGRGPTKRFRWNGDFRNTLRWLAPLVVLLSLAALVLQVHELRTSSRTPNQRPGADAGKPLQFAIQRQWTGSTQAGCSVNAHV